MTSANPPGSVTDDKTGQRYYPIDGENFWSVSTATGVIDKEGLPRWAASLAAKLAFDELPTILTASRIKPCGRTYYKCKHDWRDGHTGDCPCRACQVCVTKWLTERHIAESSRRADEGKRTHDVVNWWALHGEWIGFGDDIAPYVAAFRALIDEYGLTPDSFLLTECIVINRAYKYAGTTDGVIRFHARRTRAAAELVARMLTRATGQQVTAEQAIEQDLYVDLVVDFKTQDKPVEKEKFYPDHALQLVGYRFAPVMRIKNTEVEADFPDTHGAALIHLRPDGCTVRLTVADESTFKAFLLALNLFRWLVESGTASVSVRSFPLPKPAKKAAPRKTAPAGATPVKAARSSAPRRTVAERVGATPYPGRAGATLTDSDIPF
jgi:hypothetical protein